MSDQVGYVTTEREDELNGAIVTLNAEVNAAAAEERRTTSDGTRHPLTEFQLFRWAPLFTDWAEWTATHTGFFDRFDDEGFARLRQRYTTLRAEWVQLGQATKAPPVASSDLPEGEIISQTKSGIENAFNKLLLVGAVLGGVFLLLKAREQRQL
jgi:hypothetical protein